MKFFLIVLLTYIHNILSTLPTSNPSGTVNTHQWWEQYLTNVTLTKEPIQEEWTKRCVIGYSECDYLGQNQTICGGIHKFTVFDGIIRPDAGTPSNALKSFRIPKGFSVDLIGAYKNKYFKGELNQHQKAQIQYLTEGSFNVVERRTEDNQCAVPNPFWRAIITVHNTSYIIINDHMADFYSNVLEAKKAGFNITSAETNLQKCNLELVRLYSDKSEMDKSLNLLENEKNQYESRIKILINIIENYNKILNGIHVVNQKDKVGKQREEIVTLNKKILEINSKITIYEGKIKENNENIKKLQNTIVQLEKQILESTKSITKENEVLKKIEQEISIKFNNYTQIQNNRTNTASRINEYQNIIINLQNKIQMLNQDVNKMDCSMVQIEEEISTLRSTQSIKSLVIRNLTTTKLDLNLQIQQANAEIANLNSLIQPINNNMTILMTQAQNFTGIINRKNEKISNYTQIVLEKNKDFYNKEIKTMNEEIGKTRKNIETNRDFMTKRKESIRKLIKKIDKNKKCLIEETKTKTQFELQFNERKSNAETVKKSIDSYYQYTETLQQVIDNLRDNVNVEDWVQLTKKALHMWMDELPHDPKLDAEIVKMNLIRKSKKIPEVNKLTQVKKVKKLLN